MPQRTETTDGFRTPAGQQLPRPVRPHRPRNSCLPLAAPAPRVAPLMSSGTANRARIDFDDLQSARGYSYPR